VKAVVSEKALREFISSALKRSSTESTPIDASDEVSPRFDTGVVITISSDVEDTSPPKPNEENMTKSEKNKIESVIRSHVRKYIQERRLSEARRKKDLDDSDSVEKRNHNTVADVEGASFEEIASELGFAVSGAKQAVDKAMQKAQWLGAMQLERPDDLEITVLTAMNDYIKYLSKSGELTSADVQLLKDHPDIVRTLDGFREFLDKYVRRERKVTPKPEIN